MGFSPELEVQYETNRLRMAKINSNLHRYMWIGIVLGFIIFFTSFFVAALSTLKDQKEGPNIFFQAFSSGFLQILFSVVTIVLSWTAAMKKRAASLILLGFDCVLLLMYLLKMISSSSSINYLFLILSIALNIWIQFVFNEDEELKSQPGYPLFSLEADQRAHYELPANVIARRAQASTHMAEIGTAAAAPAENPMPQTAPVSSAPSAFDPDPDLFSDPKPVKLPPEIKMSAEGALAGMTDGTAHRTFLSEPEALSVPTDVSLDAFSAQTERSSEPAQPQLDPSVMLADMTALPSHVTVKPHADMLPSPEEVRARMAAMKRAREEHHPVE